jgi:hypothetical protein
MNNPPMVQVVWLDTNEVSDSTWQSKEDLLILENDDFVIISADKDGKNEDDLFGRSQVIPKGIIKKIQHLQEI